MAFVDTNVLLHAVSEADGEEAKRDRAREVLDRDDLTLSAQVLAEFYTQATRTSRENRISEDAATMFVQAQRRRRVVPLTAEVVGWAIVASQRFQISYWDAAIIEAARAAGETLVLTEDLDHGQDYDGVVVQNPFMDLDTS